MSKLYKISDLHTHAELDRLLPPQSPDEYEAMKADIEANRIFQPLMICRDGDSFVVIDGRHRLRAATELSHAEVPCTLLEGLGEDERIERGLLLNNRRNLTGEQKRALAATLLKKWPNKSDRTLATFCGCDHKTVATVRGELSGSGEIPQLNKRESADGKTRPATQPTRSGSIVGKKRPEKKPGRARAVSPIGDIAEAPNSGTPEKSEAVITTTVVAPADDAEKAAARSARTPQRPQYTARMQTLIKAAIAAADADDAEVAAIPTNDMMVADLVKARDLIDRVIERHARKRA